MLRRELMKAGVVAIGAAIAAGVAWLGGAVAAASSRWPVRTARKWVALCRLSDLESGEPYAAEFTFERLEGSYRERVKRKLYVGKDERGMPIVWSRRCTHLGCPVTWRTSTSKFHCACHGGVFDARGAVVEGPPDRPLDVVESRIAGDMVEVAEA